MKTEPGWAENNAKPCSQLQAFTDCSGYATRYEYDRYGQQIAIHREEGISTYSYNPRGQLVKSKTGRETAMSTAPQATATISPDGKHAAPSNMINAGVGES